MKTPDIINPRSAMEWLHIELHNRDLSLDHIIEHNFESDNALINEINSYDGPSTPDIVLYTSELIIVWNHSYGEWHFIPSNQVKTKHITLADMTPSQTVRWLNGLYDLIFTNGPAKEYVGYLYLAPVMDEDGLGIYVNVKTDSENPDHTLDEKLWDIFFNHEEGVDGFINFSPSSNNSYWNDGDDCVDTEKGYRRNYTPK